MIPEYTDGIMEITLPSPSDQDPRSRLLVDGDGVHAGQCFRARFPNGWHDITLEVAWEITDPGCWYISTPGYENEAMNRAMLATVLWRMAERPAADGPAAFSDVSEGNWYTEDVRWAASAGLISGYGGGSFGADDPVTREQIAAILWCYEGKPRADGGADFADEGQISPWASTAVDWARASGIISGRGGNRFAPRDSASRAEVAAMVMNYLQHKQGLSATAPSGDTVAAATVTPHEQQTLYLWEEGRAPAVTQYTVNNGNYSDDPDFRPYLTFYPVPEGTAVKGAVLICPGGAFMVRSDGPEGVAVAQALTQRGYQSFVVDYRLRPYTHSTDIAVASVKSGKLNVLMFPVNPLFNLLPQDSADARMKGREVRSMTQAERDAYPTKRELYDLCGQMGVPIVAMKPFAEGNILRGHEDGRLKGLLELTPVQCISCILSIPQAACPVPGFVSVDELNQTLAWLTATEEERDFSQIDDSLVGKFQNQCMYCNHCQPCPQGIDIAEVAKLTDMAQNNVTDDLFRRYSGLTATAGNCLHCGACTKRCPFGIDAERNMRRAQERFGFSDTTFIPGLYLNRVMSEKAAGFSGTLISCAAKYASTSEGLNRVQPFRARF